MATEPRELPVFTDRGQDYKSRLTQPDVSTMEMLLATAAPQTALVLEYLSSNRGLSVLIAHTVLGVASLTTRVAELRARGIPIKGEWHQDHSKRRFMVYRYDPGGVSADEPLDPYHGVETMEDEGGPPHRDELEPTPDAIPNEE